MRMFRSKTLSGPYLDPYGNNARDSGANNHRYGVKLIGNYQFKGQVGYRSAGHNSVLFTEDGRHYLVFHQRFLDAAKGEYHEVRVRQMFLNQDNWLVVAVYENKNEKIGKYTADEVVGNYEYINHGNAEKDGNMLPTKSITLEKNGGVTGDETGTWSMTDGENYTYISITLSGATYNGVFFRQSDDNEKKKMTFTAIGKNNLAIWGSGNF